MLRSNSKSLGNRVVSPEEENERLQWKGYAEKEGFSIAYGWSDHVFSSATVNSGTIRAPLLFPGLGRLVYLLRAAGQS